MKFEKSSIDSTIEIVKKIEFESKNLILRQKFAEKKRKLRLKQL